jgi:hypothetical protein
VRGIAKIQHSRFRVANLAPIVPIAHRHAVADEAVELVIVL